MAEIFLDTLGEICPIPLLRAEEQVKTMSTEDVLVLETDHNCTLRLLPRHHPPLVAVRAPFGQVGDLRTADGGARLAGLALRLVSLPLVAVGTVQLCVWGSSQHVGANPRHGASARPGLIHDVAAQANVAGRRRIK